MTANATFVACLANRSFFAELLVTVPAGSDAAREASEAAEAHCRDWQLEEADMASALGQDAPGAYRLTRPVERAEEDAAALGVEVLKTGSNG